MKKKVILTSIVAFVLLAAAIAAGLNAVFTVTHVRAEFVTVSEEGRADAAELREKLDAFIGKSTTFLNTEEVREVVESYPCFKLKQIEKQYPTTIYLSVTERKEAYVLAQKNGKYAVFDEEGKYLYEKTTTQNRASGENIVLNGFLLSNQNGALGGTYAKEIKSVFSAFCERLGEVRANVISISLVSPTSNRVNDFFRVRMREGVVIDLSNPQLKTAEKALLALDRYESISDEDRIFGFITVVDGADGKPVSDYSRNSSLD